MHREKIKQSITGNGNATKEQVFQMLQHTLNFEEDPRFMDATDALAVALCYHYQTKIPQAGDGTVSKRVSKAKKSGSWQAFIAQNPTRIVKR